MSRTLVGNIEKNSPADMSPIRPITSDSEGVPTFNVNELHAEWWPAPMVQQTWQSDTVTPYIEPKTTSYVLNGIWRRRVHKDSAGSTVRVYAEETGASQAGVIKVELASDAATYVDELTISAGTSLAWDTLDPGIDDTQTRDTIRMWTKEDASGATMRVHATVIEPTALSSIPAGVSAQGFVPFDSAEVSADQPLSTWQRKIAFDNLQIIRKTRVGDVVAWSDDWNIRTNYEALQEVGSSYVLQREFRFQSPVGCSTLEWSCTGFYGGSSGSVKLVVNEGTDNEDSQEQAFATKAASPYTSNIHDGTDLTCVENAAGQTLRVYLKGDGSTRAVLMGLCVWFGDAA